MIRRVHQNKSEYSRYINIIHIYVCVNVCAFYVFVVLDNKLYKMRGTYIKMLLYNLLIYR
jgi:hypothetical protein